MANSPTIEAVEARLENEDNLLEVRDLRMYFPIRQGLFSQVSGYVKSV